MFSIALVHQLARKNSFSKLLMQKSVIARYQSTKTISKNSIKRYLYRTTFGIIVGAIVYDGYNEFEVYGGLSRFLRSLKIAAAISIDYSWNLYGMKEGTDKYDQVLKLLYLIS